MSSRHKTIYFDIDGTLVDYEADAGRAFGKAREHAAQSYPELSENLTVDVFRRARDATYIQYGDTGLPIMEWYSECMRAALESVEVFDRDLAARMGGLYGKYRSTTLEEFDDVVEVIPRLAERYTLGLLSNGTSNIRGLGIESFFSHSVFAREVGYEKPAIEIFLAAIDIAGCGPQEILYVGDGQHTDILGAKNAGLEMVWINRNRSTLLQGIPSPDHEIHDFRQLIEVVGL
jgi:putative hydrolase of the HAD superfamily